MRRAHEVDLVFFDGCPNADEARINVRDALGGGSWREWNLSSPDTPDRFRGYGSPTVLVGGRDVTGASASSEGVSCRTDGAPSVKAIRDGLARLE